MLLQMLSEAALNLREWRHVWLMLPGSSGALLARRPDGKRLQPLYRVMWSRLHQLSRFLRLQLLLGHD
jgi:hypothetical protein